MERAARPVRAIAASRRVRRDVRGRPIPRVLSTPPAQRGRGRRLADLLVGRRRVTAGAVVAAARGRAGGPGRAGRVDLAAGRPRPAPVGERHAAVTTAVRDPETPTVTAAPAQRWWQRLSPTAVGCVL